MVYGLAGSVLVMVLEMVLFIMRAVQMEHAYEQGGDNKRNTNVGKHQSRQGVVSSLEETTITPVLQDKIKSL